MSVWNLTDIFHSVGSHSFLTEATSGGSEHHRICSSRQKPSEIGLISAWFWIEYLKSFSLRRRERERLERRVSVGPAVVRRREREGRGGGDDVGGRSAAGSQRYSRKSNEREPNEAILKGDIVGSLARRTNSITSSGIERRKREEAPYTPDTGTKWTLPQERMRHKYLALFPRVSPSLCASTLPRRVPSIIRRT